MSTKFNWRGRIPLKVQGKTGVQENFKETLHTAYNESGMVWANKYIQGPYAET